MKYLFTPLLLFYTITFIYAQHADTIIDCSSAHDSAKHRIARNEIGFYSLIKFKKNQYNFITIDKDRYVKHLHNKGVMDESFVKCYNDKMKKKLDSIFKVSFFEKSDSILKSYDNTGRGYKNAEYPGGPGALQKFISKNTSIPKETKLNDSKQNDANTLVQVFYSFYIDEEGKISNIALIKSNCSACEEPVLEAIKKLPAFIPATEAGKPAKIKYILPYMKKL